MDLEEALAAASQDPNVHGILIYYPCFGAAPSFYGAMPRKRERERARERERQRERVCV